jgi:Skp family chaperone for outer membrane proteins
MESFNRDVAGWNQDATARKSELTSWAMSWRAIADAKSDEKRREKGRTTSASRPSTTSSCRVSKGRTLTKRNEEILQPIVSKIQVILAKIGEEGYDLILDAANGNILYADQSLDLTQRVIQELGKEQL